MYYITAYHIKNILYVCHNVCEFISIYVCHFVYVCMHLCRDREYVRENNGKEFIARSYLDCIVHIKRRKKETIDLTGLFFILCQL